MTDKEKNKLIERTAKFDAYQNVVMWAEHRSEAEKGHGSAYWYAKEKMEGHRKYVKDHKYYYEYSTSEFIEKKTEVENAN